MQPAVCVEKDFELHVLKNIPPHAAMQTTLGTDRSFKSNLKYSMTHTFFFSKKEKVKNLTKYTQFLALKRGPFESPLDVDLEEPGSNL